MDLIRKLFIIIFQHIIILLKVLYNMVQRTGKRFSLKKKEVATIPP